MTSGESVTVAVDRKRPRGLGAMLRSQMRNIAPFLTLIFLSAFFALAPAGGLPDTLRGGEPAPAAPAAPAAPQKPRNPVTDITPPRNPVTDVTPPAAPATPPAVPAR